MINSRGILLFLLCKSSAQYGYSGYSENVYGQGREYHHPQNSRYYQQEQSPSPQGIGPSYESPYEQSPYERPGQGQEGGSYPYAFTGYQSPGGGSYQNGNGNQWNGYQINGYQGSGYQGIGYQGNGYHGSTSQGSGYQSNGYQGSTNQGSGYRSNGYQGSSSQGNGYQSNSYQGSNNQGSRYQSNGYQGSNNQGGGYQSNSNQGSENQGSGQCSSLGNTPNIINGLHSVSNDLSIVTNDVIKGLNAVSHPILGWLSLPGYVIQGASASLDTVEQFSKGIFQIHDICLSGNMGSLLVEAISGLKQDHDKLTSQVQRLSRYPMVNTIMKTFSELLKGVEKIISAITEILDSESSQSSGGNSGGDYSGAQLTTTSTDGGFAAFTSLAQAATSTQLVLASTDPSPYSSPSPPTSPSILVSYVTVTASLTTSSTPMVSYVTVTVEPMALVRSTGISDIPSPFAKLEPTLSPVSSTSITSGYAPVTELPTTAVAFVDKVPPGVMSSIPTPDKMTSDSAVIITPVSLVTTSATVQILLKSVSSSRNSTHFIAGILSQNTGIVVPSRI